jgi:hypothetical protein
MIEMVMTLVRILIINRHLRSPSPGIAPRRPRDSRQYPALPPARLNPPLTTPVQDASNV